MGQVLHGWAVARLGEPQRGARSIAAGLEASRATGARMDDQHYLALLADARLLGGERDAAEAAIDEGLALGRRLRSRHLEPELLRLRAVALGRDAPRAQATLREAIAVAGEQGSRMLELRARTELVTLLRHHQAAASAARGALAALLERLSEGHATADVQAAQRALHEPVVSAR
jgi:predicted Zn-dependent peptidase